MVSAAAAVATSPRAARAPGTRACGTRPAAQRTEGRAGGAPGRGAGWAAPPRGGSQSASLRSLADSEVPGPRPARWPRRAGWGLAAGRARERFRGGGFSRRGSPGIPFALLKRSPPWLPLRSPVVATESPVEAELEWKGWCGESDSAGGGGGCARAHRSQCSGLGGPAGGDGRTLSAPGRGPQG